MKYHETGQPIPEMTDMEVNEVDGLYGTGSYLAAISIRNSLIYVISDNKKFNKTWIYSGSMLFAQNAQNYENEKIITAADQSHEYFKTRMYDKMYLSLGVRTFLLFFSCLIGN